MRETEFVQRVVVVGSGGAGKSTFAAAPGEFTGLPVVHLDRHFWRPGWVETPREEWRQLRTDWPVAVGAIQGSRQDRRLPAQH